MIYLKTNRGQHVLILEHENIERLTSGRPAVSPNQEVMIAYTPDPVWLSEQITRAAFDGTMTSEKMDAMIAESQKRPINPDRPHRSTQQVVKDGVITGTSVFSKKVH